QPDQCLAGFLFNLVQRVGAVLQQGRQPLGLGIILHVAFVQGLLQARLTAFGMSFFEALCAALGQALLVALFVSCGVSFRAARLLRFSFQLGDFFQYVLG